MMRVSCGLTADAHPLFLLPRHLSTFVPDNDRRKSMAEEAGVMERRTCYMGVSRREQQKCRHSTITW